MAYNFKYLGDLIHSGIKEILLDSDIIFDDVEDSEYLGGIRLSDGLVLDGNGHTIDARKKTRIFYTYGGNVTIKNIILKNGNSKEGGAIYNDGGCELNIENSVLSNNQADDEGGAIYNTYDVLRIKNCIIEKNESLSGGVIYNEKAIEIKDTTIRDNNASNGGVIHNVGVLTLIENSDFLSNVSTSAMIRNSTISGYIRPERRISIINSNFHENVCWELIKNLTEEYGGGTKSVGVLDASGIALEKNECRHAAIYNEGDSKIKNSTVQENSLSQLIINHGILKVCGCDVVQNTGENSLLINDNVLRIENSNFKDNASKIIIDNCDKGNFGIFYGSFISNQVSYCIVNNGIASSINQTVFQNSSSGSSVGNICNAGDLTLQEIILKDEGISIFNKGDLFLKNAPKGFENHIENEGAITYPREDSRNKSNRDFSHIPNDFKKYDFTYLDEMIHDNHGTVKFNHDISLKSYELDFYEGGIELDVDNIVIDGNGKTIDADGKSRFFIITGKNVTLKNIVFKNGTMVESYENPLNIDGGALKIYPGSNVTLDNCEFVNNNSINNGGAIYNNGDKLVLINADFSDSMAKYNGGTIYNANGELTITDTAISKSHADLKGGAIYNDRDKLLLSHVVLSYCDVEDSGGAIYNNPDGLTLIECSLSHNSAYDYGGAIYNEGDGLTINGGNFSRNSAPKMSGGAIYSEGDKPVLDGVTFSDNIAGYTGGAICNKCKCSTVNNCTFSGNESENQGGGAIHNHGDLKIAESAFNSNSSQVSGGALFVYGKLLMKNCDINNNSSRKGEVVHFKESEIYDSNFISNRGNDYNGIISLKEGKTIIKGCSFEGNTPKIHRLGVMVSLNRFHSKVFFDTYYGCGFVMLLLALAIFCFSNPVLRVLLCLALFAYIYILYSVH